MRRLDYLQSKKPASSSQSSSSSLLRNDHRKHLSSSEGLQVSRASETALDPGYHQDGGSANRETVLRLHKLTKPSFWPFRTITLKFGSFRLVVSTRKIVLSCFLVLIYYLLRRKLTAVKRYAPCQIKYIVLISLFLLAISKLIPYAS